LHNPSKVLEKKHVTVEDIHTGSRKNYEHKKQS